MAPPAMNRATIDVLGLLFQAWEHQTEVHGWQLMRSLRRSGPTVYAVLDRLEDAGWVAGSWESPADGAEGRPRRRYYRLTPSGAEAARRHAVVPSPAPPARPRPAPGFGRHAPLPAGGPSL
ncbi:PadR family transcriptional regulator [Micromonospora sp. 4G57]|uniref:PadR family transcriptional regulator n=1 Tax=Micromonospora sicca TaxID=2202420 RepID=A0ABU5J6D4_9ACTN|nr:MULTISPECIES: PadR family transcriptional regulator [unclassified Micromonospora]MDZ5443361.1 PadR family transcriptional regulator [Micromonospora sp. 4G57]MDZ5488139.1 PadR family transcriptional regulator [Micromonospora sp. 4G53]